MLIDWFTVIAQIINFLVLLYLLKRFLYGPIVQAMEAREQRVLEQLRRAEQQQAAAEQCQRDYEQQHAALAEQREALLTEAQHTAAQHREDLLHAARADVAALQERWHATLRHSQAAFLHDLRQRTGAEVVAMTRAVLTDMADASLEAQSVAVFLRQLQALDNEQQATLRQARALNGTRQPVVVQSAFPLSAEQGAAITRELCTFFADRVEPDFVVDPDLVCGIRLLVHGHEAAWSFQSYLDRVEEQVARLLTEETPDNPPDEPAPATEETAAVA